jgi:HK97 family phage portal protein
MKSVGKGKKQATDKTLYRILHDKPNPFLSAMQFRETMMAHILTWGNGYAEIVRSAIGDVVQLWPITPDRVRIDWEDSQPVYYIRVDTKEIPLHRDKILHISGLGFDGVQGYSVISMARQAIGLGMAMEEFGARYFGAGTHPGAIVSHPGKLSAQAHDNLKVDLQTKYAGLGQSHRLLLLEEGMKLENLGIPPEDSQFLESRTFQIPEIARWFNLPPHKLKDLTKSSFNNIESEQISFVTDSILPWLVRCEQAYNMQLLSENEQYRQRLYFKHNVEGLLRGNSVDRAMFYKEMFYIGAMSPNDIRAKEDLDPIDGGDEYFVPVNMIPLSKLDQLPMLQTPEKIKQEEPEEETGDEADEAESAQGNSKPNRRARADAATSINRTGPGKTVLVGWPGEKTRKANPGHV